MGGKQIWLDTPSCFDTYTYLPTFKYIKVK